MPTPFAMHRLFEIAGEKGGLVTASHVPGIKKIGGKRVYYHNAVFQYDSGHTIPIVIGDIRNEVKKFNAQQRAQKKPELDADAVNAGRYPGGNPHTNKMRLEVRVDDVETLSKIKQVLVNLKKVEPTKNR